MPNETNKRRRSSGSDKVIHLTDRDIRSNGRRHTREGRQGAAAGRRSGAEQRKRNTASTVGGTRRTERSGDVRERRPSQTPVRRRAADTDLRRSSRTARRADNTAAQRRTSEGRRQAPADRRRAQRPVQKGGTAAQRPRRQQDAVRRERRAAPVQRMPRKNTSANALRKGVYMDGKNSYIVLSQYLPPVILKTDRDARGEQRQHAKAPSRGKGSVGIVAAVLAVLFVIYICGYAFSSGKNENIPYETIQIGGVDSAKKAEGIIIRSEKVFNAPASGAVEYAVPENEKIRSGAVVCTISNAQTVAQLQENLDSINNDILKMQQSREDLSSHTEEVNKLEAQIKTLADENTFDFASGDFADVYNLRYSVENKMNTRNQLLLSENSSSLSDLVGQRENELKQMNENIKQVTSDVGGIVCYSVDGSEEELTPDAIDSLTKERVTQKTEEAEGFKSNVAANEPVFKIITSNKWYIASYLPDSYTEGWEPGREMEIYMDNGVEKNRVLDVTLQVIKHGEKEAYAVFETADFVSDYMDVRNVSFEIDKPKTGYKIPDTSISQQTLLKIPAEYVNTDRNTVVKVTENGDKTLQITVSGTENGEDGSFVLVPVQMGYLNTGDTLRSGEKTFKLESVVTVDGVFLVNSGVTKFVKINMDGAVSGGGYTVLDEAANPNLHIYDRVVQNVVNVQENQNIYE